MRCAICNQPIHQNQRTKLVRHRDGTVFEVHTVHHEWDQDEDRLIPKPALRSPHGPAARPTD